MEPKDKDIFQQFFASMPDEVLPTDFNTKVMQKIIAEAAIRAKKHTYMEVLGYVSGGITMLVVCALVFSFYEVSIKLPKLELPNLAFLKPDYELFKSQSFYFSLFIGISALFLLIVDSTIRRNIEKIKNKQ